MPAIQARLAPVKNPAPTARPRIPNVMTTIARTNGPEDIPARTDAPPKRESKPPAAATIAIIVTPTGPLGFGAVDCITSRFRVYMISLLDMPMAGGMRETTRSPLNARNGLFQYTFQRLLGSCGVMLPGLGVVLTAATG